MPLEWAMNVALRLQGSGGLQEGREVISIWVGAFYQRDLPGSMPVFDLPFTVSSRDDRVIFLNMNQPNQKIGLGKIADCFCPMLGNSPRNIRC